MDGEKKTKKGGAKKDVKFEEDAPSGQDLVFGAASNTDMVNFGGDDDNFGQKEREHNIIRK